jgi:hypothetical protein
MANNNYEDPILNNIIKVLDKDGPKDLVGRYGTGDPAIVNKAQLKKPMAFLSFDNARVGDESSSHLKFTATLIINLVDDMTKDFGQGLQAKSHNTIVGLMAGMAFDEDNGYYIRDDTVVGAIRKNQDMGHGLRIDMGDTSNIDYDAMTRNKGLVTTEGVLEIHVTVSFLKSQYRNA